MTPQVIINELPEYVRRKLVLCPELFLKNKANDVDFKQQVLKPLILELHSLNDQGKGLNGIQICWEEMLRLVSWHTQ